MMCNGILAAWALTPVATSGHNVYALKKQLSDLVSQASNNTAVQGLKASSSQVAAGHDLHMQLHAQLQEVIKVLHACVIIIVIIIIIIIIIIITIITLSIHVARTQLHSHHQATFACARPLNSPFFNPFPVSFSNKFPFSFQHQSNTDAQISRLQASIAACIQSQAVPTTRISTQDPPFCLCIQSSSKRQNLLLFDNPMSCTLL
jgi:hypothetical protein